jgi:hypothetical protein
MNKIYHKAIGEIKACIHHGLDEATDLDVFLDDELVLTFSFKVLTQVWHEARDGGHDERMTEIAGVEIEEAIAYAKDKQFDVTPSLQEEVAKHW